MTITTKAKNQIEIKEKIVKLLISFDRRNEKDHEKHEMIAGINVRNVE